MTHLPPFALDHWLSAYDFATPPIAYNLASSTGPRWSVADLCALGDAPLAIDDAVLSYAPPQGSPALRHAIAAFHGVDADSVIATTGSSEALSILFCLGARPGANIVLPDPGYPAYAAVAQAWGLSPRFYRLERADGFAQRADAILAQVDADTSLVILNTPHNPTGTVMPRDEIAVLAAALATRGVPLLVDEVYHPLYFTAPQPSAAGIPNVIVTSDLSKALSLPGLRTGWLIDADVDRRARMIDARSYFTISSSPLLERLATHALTHSDAILDRLRAVAQANIAMLDALVAGSNGRLDWVRPDGGTTAFPWLADGRDSRPFCQALAAQGVLLAPGDCFGHPAHMRLGFAQQAEGFDVAAGRIAAALAAL
ncbi:pyridoxal phosphate-dependent aminotransferase [Sphingobium sp. CAP-1]|uniref:pyridoxal phosphate-dependent aminotransferase n=1 Tax=Sphingobium sp. CAP-1 TaxID=2676077 RepID=UPI0012BB4127|nr:pyridoxal phosphate-dependent aminotransferase [Sphingobium sp. CAP-1]QGP79740.1 aminotransferase class I/II-fold pyridoxal phosphate-dependent enzyme [Sphingobium sp. CAP-1]